MHQSLREFSSTDYRHHVDSCIPPMINRQRRVYLEMKPVAMQDLTPFERGKITARHENGQSNFLLIPKLCPSHYLTLLPVSPVPMYLPAAATTSSRSSPLHATVHSSTVNSGYS